MLTEKEKIELFKEVEIAEKDAETSYIDYWAAKNMNPKNHEFLVQQGMVRTSQVRYAKEMDDSYLSGIMKALAVLDLDGEYYEWRKRYK